MIVGIMMLSNSLFYINIYGQKVLDFIGLDFWKSFWFIVNFDIKPFYLYNISRLIFIIICNNYKILSQYNWNYIIIHVRVYPFNHYS